MLEPMNIIRFQINFNKSKDLQILNEISIIQSSSNVRSNIQKMAVGLVMIEILDKTTHNYDPSIIIFKLIEKSLSILNNWNINNLVLLQFYRIQFAKYSGFNPVTNQCHNCDNFIQNAFYNQNNGYLNCNNCKSLDAFELSEKNFKLLKLLSFTHINELNTLEINFDSIKLIEKYLHYFMLFHLHGMNNIKSLKFLNEVNSI